MENNIATRSRPTVAELVALVAEYNRAWDLELRSNNGQVQPPGKNPFMDGLYVAAVVATEELKVVLTVNLDVEGPK